MPRAGAHGRAPLSHPGVLSMLRMDSQLALVGVASAPAHHGRFLDAGGCLSNLLLRTLVSLVCDVVTRAGVQVANEVSQHRIACLKGADVGREACSSFQQGDELAGVIERFQDHPIVVAFAMAAHRQRERKEFVVHLAIFGSRCNSRTPDATPARKPATRPLRKGSAVDTSIVERFHYQGWRVLVYVWWDLSDRRFAGRAELYRQGAFRCRIALGKNFENVEEAVDSLRSRARAFITDWERRVHNSDSEFSEL